jgi:hypothetical protein
MQIVPRLPKFQGAGRQRRAMQMGSRSMQAFLRSSAVAAIAVSAPALAADFSFTGQFGGWQDCRFFNFKVDQAGPVTIRTLSASGGVHSGGVNAAGVAIPAGGFDPVVGLYSMPSGDFIFWADDSPLPGQSNYASPDVNFTMTLAAGRYRIALLGYPQAPNPSYPLSRGFEYGCAANGEWFNSGDLPHYALDILNVTHASRYVPQNLGDSRTFVPEPAAWALLIAGFGLTGAAMRRRRARHVPDQLLARYQR